MANLLLIFRAGYKLSQADLSKYLLKVPGRLEYLLRGNTTGFLLLLNQRLNNLITMDQRSLLVTLLVDSTTLQAEGTRNWVVL